MSLSAALGFAISGLDTTRAATDAVAANIANAGSAGYRRREAVTAEISADGRLGAVRLESVRRVVDRMVERQVITETAASAHAATRAESLAAVDALFGVPGSAAALDTQVNRLAAALSALTGDPASAFARQDVLAAATTLAGTLGALSGEVQALRQDAERAIGEAATRANELLTGITEADSRLAGLTDAAEAPAVLDARDRLVGELAGLVDLRVLQRPDGRIALMTGSGLTLYGDGEAARLAFDGPRPLSAEALADPDPALNGVGRLTLVTPDGQEIDLAAPGALRAGRIAELMALRDVDLPAVQDGLDTLAARLAAGLTDAGGGPPGFSVFVDAGTGAAYAGSLAAGPPRTGLAARLAVDPALLADPSRLVVSGPGVAAGDRTRPALLMERLAETQVMTPTDWTGRAGSSESLTVTGLARRLVGAVGARAAEAQRLDEGQKVLTAALAARRQDASGVDIDREMARLVELQTAWSANARVLSAVREMLDALMRI